MCDVGTAVTLWHELLRIGTASAEVPTPKMLGALGRKTQCGPVKSPGGEGGMISTNNKSIWKKCWSMKDHGKNYHSVFYKKHKEGFRWLHDYQGSNFRMTEMQSALGRYQLKNLDQYIKKRNKIAYL